MSLAERTWTLLLPLCLLWGCQALPPREDIQPEHLIEAGNQDRLAAFDHWILRGKIGITREGTRESAAINHWQQDRESFEIQLSSTVLGLGATTISGGPDHLQIVRPGESPLLSTSPQALLEDSLGWQVPLSALPYWVKGQPAPHSDFTWQVPPAAQTVVLEQSGWRILFERIEARSFPPGSPAVLLPHKVVLTRDDQEIKLVISQWESI